MSDYRTKFGEHNGYYGDIEMSLECRDWIKELEQRIKDAEKVIEFYGKEDSWFQSDDYYGEAREYQDKYMKDKK